MDWRCTQSYIFQSTLPREERQSIINGSKAIIKFQSTLPREERLYFRKYIIKTVKISIHAPTRGATNDKQGNASKIIFQSTLPREERPFAPPARTHTRTFQSTLPREERPHAPCLSFACRYFNPRSHERSDVLPRPSQMT